MIVIFNSGEYQDSRVVLIGFSFPMAPAGSIVTRRVPSHSTPSIICVPSCSVFELALRPRPPEWIIAGSEESSSRSVKLNVKRPWTLTGLPESSVGLNCHCLAACNAASRNNGWPLTAFASMTSPDSLTVIITWTAPLALAALAIGGYSGCTLLRARPCNALPKLSFLTSDAPGDSVGGGGGGGAMRASMPILWAVLV